MTTEPQTQNETGLNHAAQDEALTAYQNGDYATALAAWQPLADAGDAQAQFNLAIMYHNGQGTEPDAAKALAYCTLAADNDIPPAQHYLGYLLMILLNDWPSVLYTLILLLSWSGLWIGLFVGFIVMIFWLGMSRRS